MGLTISCRKVCHPTRSDASSAIRQMVVSGKDSDERFPIRPYFCDQCDAWHCGHDRFADEVPD